MRLPHRHPDDDSPHSTTETRLPSGAAACDAEMAGGAGSLPSWAMVVLRSASQAIGGVSAYHEATRPDRH